MFTHEVRNPLAHSILGDEFDTVDHVRAQDASAAHPPGEGLSSRSGPRCSRPRFAAQMASTYQRMSHGRLLVNIVTGAEPPSSAPRRPRRQGHPGPRRPPSSSRCSTTRGPAHRSTSPDASTA